MPSTVCSSLIRLCSRPSLRPFRSLSSNAGYVFEQICGSLAPDHGCSFLQTIQYFRIIISSIRKLILIRSFCFLVLENRCAEAWKRFPLVSSCYDLPRVFSPSPAAAKAGLDGRESLQPVRSNWPATRHANAITICKHPFECGSNPNLLVFIGITQIIEQAAAPLLG